MPVSSPSYFPPNRSNGSIIGITAGTLAIGARDFLAMQAAGNNSSLADLIVIGHNSLKAGVANAANAGTLVIGNTSLSAFTGVTGPITLPAGIITSVGFNIASLVPDRIGACVFVGANILAGAQANSADIASSVIIGADATSNLQFSGAESTDFITSSVIVGWRAARGQTSAHGRVSSSVVIGSEAARDTGFNVDTSNAQLDRSVIIGCQAGLQLAGGQNTLAQNSVFIGFQCATTPVTSSNNVCIGASIVLANASGSNVVIGTGITANWDVTGGNVAIGANLQIGVGIGHRNVVLGFQAGGGIPGGGSNYFNVEVDDGAGTRSSALYAHMGTGCIALGNTTNAQRGAVNVPNGATNVVIIPNGTKSGTNPTAGGYFYVTAGALHWVGSAGTDTAIAPA